MDSTVVAKLVVDLLIAIQGLSSYPVPDRPPAVHFVRHAALEQMACSGPCRVYGWFPPGDTIYLDDRLDPIKDIGARGILVHELVHYLQQEAGAYSRTANCRTWTERESEAFDVQIRWLTKQPARLRALSPLARAPSRLDCRDGPEQPNG